MSFSNREKELARKLITQSHLEAGEKSEFAHGKIPGLLLAGVIAEMATNDGWFPKDRRPNDDFSGALIEKAFDGSFRIYWKKEVRMMRYELKGIQNFKSAAQAATVYAKKIFLNGIDGLTIMWSASKQHFTLPTLNFRTLARAALWLLLPLLFFSYAYSYWQTRVSRVLVHSISTWQDSQSHDIVTGAFGPNFYVKLVLSTDEKKWNKMKSHQEVEQNKRDRIRWFYWPLVQAELIYHRGRALWRKVTAPTEPSDP